MAISIDTVYQKVLVLANKEQRGYITPQEFNLLADKAQNDIFESYFNLDSRKIDKKNLDGDNLDLLPEKLDKFYQESSTITDSISLNIPTALYKLRYIKKDNIILTEISKEEIFYVNSHPLTKPTTTRPAFVRYNDSLVYLYPAPSTNTSSEAVIEKSVAFTLTRGPPTVTHVADVISTLSEPLISTSFADVRTALV